jgi:hypothetical protein
MSGRPFWYQVTYSPETAQQTRLRCDVYASNPASKFKFDDTIKEALEQQIHSEIQGFESQHKELVASGHDAIGNSMSIPIYEQEYQN